MSSGNMFSSPDQPLYILIVGAGIGGLTAGLALRRRGHNVEIFEQSRLAHETGAAIHLAPNANGLLKRLGFRPEDYAAVELGGIREQAPDGSTVSSIDLHEVRKSWQHPYHLIHRGHLHTALKRLAVSTEGDGPPVKLHVATPVRDVDAKSAKVTTKDGKVFAGDLLIGADGVHSITRSHIPGGDLKPYDSGRSAFRFLVPREILESDPHTKKFMTPDDYLVTSWGNDRKLVMYPCINKTMLNFAAIHPSRLTSTDGPAAGWQESGSKDRLIEVYKGFDAGVMGILQKVDPDEVKIWNLLTMDKMPTFIHEKLAVIGDAAHPFLPDLGQGGAQAIEDAVSIAALLPMGTQPAEIQERLALYEKCRYTRSNHIQYLTQLAGRDKDAIGPDDEKMDFPTSTAYNITHDEWDFSSNVLREHLESKNPCKRSRAPYGFGPAPGPRQPLGLPQTHPHIEELRSLQPERFTTYAVRLRSSRTFLQNLLPPGFAFTGLATVAYVTLECVVSHSMTWLGGTGYNRLGLNIHGVNYTKKDGSKVHGSYLVVLFEDLADSISTGREEIGSPKVFCDINVRAVGDSAAISLGWRGMQFAHLQIDGLHDEEKVKPAEPEHKEPNGVVPPPPPEEGLLMYRYVPAVGKPGTADAEYALLFPTPDMDAPKSHLTRTVEKPQIARSASVSFLAGDLRSLPTLHYITSKLAEMPVYEVEGARKWDYVGQEDLSTVFRLE